MGLFRRKPKEKRINKKLVITLEILGAVLLFGILLGSILRKGRFY